MIPSRAGGRVSRWIFPRKRLDIGWLDLGAAVVRALVPGSRDPVERRLEARWSPSGDSLVCLSVRSGFDLLLSALSLPAGSEVIVSAITIPDMVRILEEHRLVVVPVDLDMDRLEVRVEDLERAVTPATRAALIAHLYGSRVRMEPIVDVSRRHGLILIEDRAQAYAGPRFREHPRSDASMFSFGPIKTATALGGALIRVRDPSLLERMRSIARGYPIQGRAEFLSRTLKFSALKLLSQPTVYGLWIRATQTVGKSHEEIISRSVRGFVGPDLIEMIRRRPSAPLLSLVDRRLRRFDRDALARRIATSERLSARLPPTIPRPGRLASEHSHWLFPIVVDRPDEVVTGLLPRGFDATRGGTSLLVVDPPPGRPGAEPFDARRTLEHVVYLPVPEGLGERGLDRLVVALEELVAVANQRDASVSR